MAANSRTVLAFALLYMFSAQPSPIDADKMADAESYVNKLGKKPCKDILINSLAIAKSNQCNSMASLPTSMFLKPCAGRTEIDKVREILCKSSTSANRSEEAIKYANSIQLASCQDILLRWTYLSWEAKDPCMYMANANEGLFQNAEVCNGITELNRLKAILCHGAVSASSGEPRESLSLKAKNYVKTVRTASCQNALLKWVEAAEVTADQCKSIKAVTEDYFKPTSVCGGVTEFNKVKDILCDGSDTTSSGETKESLKAKNYVKTVGSASCRNALQQSIMAAEVTADQCKSIQIFTGDYFKPTSVCGRVTEFNKVKEILCASSAIVLLGTWTILCCIIGHFLSKI